MTGEQVRLFACGVLKHVKKLYSETQYIDTQNIDNSNKSHYLGPFGCCSAFDIEESKLTEGFAWHVTGSGS